VHIHNVLADSNSGAFRHNHYLTPIIVWPWSPPSGWEAVTAYWHCVRLWYLWEVSTNRGPGMDDMVGVGWARERGREGRTWW